MPPKKKANVVKEEVQAAEHQPEPQAEVRAEPAQPNPNFGRSENFYFDAGDIALCAKVSKDEEPPDWVVYRVDKAFLGRHSAVLAAKFQSPATRRAPEERYDGVPLITLDDRGGHVHDLLSFMYNPAFLLKWLRDPNRDVAEGIKNLLAIADKYKVDGVKPFMLHLLEHDWPPTLAEWLRLQCERSRLRDLWALSCVGLSNACLDDLYPVDAASAVSIGLAHAMPSILPAAFYALASIDIRDDWERYNKDEPWQFSEIKDAETSDPQENWRPTARWSWLEKDALMQLLVVKQALQARRAALGRVYKFACPANCARGRHNCPNELARLATDYGTKFAGSGPCQPLEALIQMLTTTKDNVVLCGPCRLVVRSNVNQELEKLWADLPDMFTLKKEGQAAEAG